MDATELRELRLKVGMPQAEFARQLGVKPTTVCCWENGSNPFGHQYWDRAAEILETYKPPGPEEWFWPKCLRGAADECWPWTQMQAGGGYGAIRRDGRLWHAHRMAWTIVNGPIPERVNVLHRCDNRVCVNPAHLFLGTHRDNSDDMRAKGRDRYHWREKPPRGERQANALLTDDRVRGIRVLYATKQFRQRQLAAMFNVSPATIAAVLTRQSWKHVE